MAENEKDGQKMFEIACSCKRKNEKCPSETEEHGRKIQQENFCFGLGGTVRVVEKSSGEETKEPVSKRHKCSSSTVEAGTSAGSPIPQNSENSNSSTSSSTVASTANKNPSTKTKPGAVLSPQCVTELPLDMLEHICSFVTLYLDLCRLERVNKLFAGLCWKSMSSLWVDFSQEDQLSVWFQDFKVSTSNSRDVLKSIWKKASNLKHIRLAFSDVTTHDSLIMTKQTSRFLNNVFELNSIYPRKIGSVEFGEYFAESAFAAMLINNWSCSITDLDLWWEKGKPGGSAACALWAAIGRCSRLRHVQIAGLFSDRDDGVDRHLCRMLENKDNLTALSLANYHQRKLIEDEYDDLAEEIATLLTRYDSQDRNPKKQAFRLDLTISDDVGTTGNGSLLHFVSALTSIKTPCEGFKFVTQLVIYAKERVGHFDYKPILDRFPNLTWCLMVLECEEIEPAELVCDFIEVFSGRVEVQPNKKRLLEIALFNKDARKVSETFGLLLPRVFEETGIIGVVDLPSVFLGNLGWTGDYQDTSWGVLEQMRVRFDEQGERNRTGSKNLAVVVRAGERQD